MKATEEQKFEMRKNILLVQTALDEWRNAVNMDCELDDILRRIETLGEYVSKALEASVNIGLDSLELEPGMKFSISGSGKWTRTDKLPGDP